MAVVTAAVLTVFPGSCITSFTRSRMGKQQCKARVEVLAESIQKSKVDVNCVTSERAQKKFSDILGEEMDLASHAEILKPYIVSFNRKVKRNPKSKNELSKNIAEILDQWVMGAVFNSDSKEKVDFWISYFTVPTMGRASWEPAAYASLGNSEKVKQAEAVLLEECRK